MCETAWHIVIRLVGMVWLLMRLAAVGLAEPGLAGRFTDRPPMLRAASAPLVDLRGGPPAPRGSLFATGARAVFLPPSRIGAFSTGGRRAARCAPGCAT